MYKKVLGEKEKYPTAKKKGVCKGCKISKLYMLLKLKEGFCASNLKSKENSRRDDTVEVSKDEIIWCLIGCDTEFGIYSMYKRSF